MKYRNMKGTKEIVFFFTIVLFSCFGCPASYGQVDLFGYFENRAYIVENPDVDWGSLGEKLRLGDYNRLRMKVQASPSEKVTVNVAVDFFTYHGLMETTVWSYIAPNTPTPSSVRIDLDRAYVDLHFKKLDLSIGKQRVALGVSYLWAPLDVFNRINVFEPKEEKPGVNAFKVYVPLGASSSFTGVFSPDQKVKSSTSASRLKTQVLGVDAALTLIRLGARETSVYGLDLRGENFIGWWIEAGYFVSPAEDDTGNRRKDLKLVLGFDYTVPLGRGLYWLNEFYYDETGGKTIAHYDYLSLYSGQRFTLGRRYLFSMLRFPFSQFLTGSLAYIANWGDGSYILNPAIQYEISQDIMISSGFYLPLGRKNGEFRKYKENTFFVWLKINF